MCRWIPFTRLSEQMETTPSWNLFKRSVLFTAEAFV